MSQLDREKAVTFIYDLLRILVARNGSDLFITAAAPPSMKLGGKMTPLSSLVMTPNHTMEIARAIMNDKQSGEFERTREANFAISPLGYWALSRQHLLPTSGCRHGDSSRGDINSSV
jgi:twitching motility protein PilU